MNIGKFVLNVVLAYIIYAALYILTTMVIFGDVFMANAGLMRPQDDPLVMYAYGGHLLQTVVVVLLFNMAVGSGDIKKGATFGALIGAYLAATDMSFYFGLQMDTSPLALSIVIHLAVGAIVGSFLAFMHGKGMGSSGGAGAAENGNEVGNG